MTAMGSYSQADEDRSLPTCCPRPQTINRNCGSTDYEICLNPDTRDRWCQAGYDDRDYRHGRWSVWKLGEQAMAGAMASACSVSL